MLSKKNCTKIFWVIFVMVLLVGCKTQKADKSQILAEWNEGKITENNLEKRLALALKSMPVFYRPQNGFSIEQKQKYLENYAIEDVFYLEAIEMETDQNADVKDFYEEQIMTIVLQEYLQKEVKEKISVTDTLLKKFYEENGEIFPSDKPFEKIKGSVEKNYKAQKEIELMEQLSLELLEKYEVFLDTTALENIDFEKADTSETEANIQLIKSSIEEINFTVKDFADEIKKLPERQKQTLSAFAARKEFLTQKMKNNSAYYDAIQKDYDKLPELEEKLFRLKKYGALREYYKLMVIDSVSVLDEEIKEFYENEKEKKFSNQEFEKVAPQIESFLSKEKQKERFEVLKDEITTKHNLKLYPERLLKILPLDSLKQLAEDSYSKQKFHAAARYYDQIIEYYKNGKDDYNAAFMAGFIYSENLNNTKKAKEMFEKVLAFPAGELHESAEYMLQSISGSDEILEKIEKNIEREKE